MSAGDAQARIRKSRWLLWKNPENLTDRHNAPNWTGSGLVAPHAVSRLSAGRSTPAGVPARSRRCPARAGPLADLGRPAAASPNSLPPDPAQSAPRHRTTITATVDPPTIQRPGRIHQHQTPTPDPQRLRLQKPRSPHRPRPARPRWPQTHPPRPITTHGSVTRAAIGATAAAPEAIATGPRPLLPRDSRSDPYCLAPARSATSATSQRWDNPHVVTTHPTPDAAGGRAIPAATSAPPH